MSSTTDPQPGGFRPGMLLSDTRYRSYTFQVIAILVLGVVFWELYSNLINNLRAAGLNISWAFLGEPAGYDINQRPIEYDSQSTHARASVVGAINTLIVAFLACATATVIGVIAGVLRLSNNWVVSKLMSAYVEAFRNVPVLIWILIIFLAMSNILYQPRDFRGADPVATMYLFDSIAFTNRGVYVPGLDFTRSLGEMVFNFNGALTFFSFATSAIAVLLVGGIMSIFGQQIWAKLGVKSVAMSKVWATLGLVFVIRLFFRLRPDVAYSADGSLNGTFGLSLNFLAFAVVIFAGWMIARYIGQQANKKQTETGIRPTIWWMQALAVLLPVLVLGAFLGAYLSYPELKGFNFKGGIHLRLSLIALWFALAIYTGAFIAENVRAGIQAVSKGQTEAAASLGLRPGRIMNLVILPQALRVIIPPLISNYLNITKNSSLAIAVGYMDITGTLGGITLNQTGRAIECILLLMLFYLIISLGISAIMNVYNNRMKLKER
ncbi:MAG: amino acid ABC transporter permease [Planktomarina sp.]